MKTATDPLERVKAMRDSQGPRLTGNYMTSDVDSLVLELEEFRRITAARTAKSGVLTGGLRVRAGFLGRLVLQLQVEASPTQHFRTALPGEAKPLWRDARLGDVPLVLEVLKVRLGVGA